VTIPRRVEEGQKLPLDIKLRKKIKGIKIIIIIII